MDKIFRSYYLITPIKKGAKLPFNVLFESIAYLADMIA